MLFRLACLNHFTVPWSLLVKMGSSSALTTIPVPRHGFCFDVKSDFHDHDDVHALSLVSWPIYVLPSVLMRLRGLVHRSPYARRSASLLSLSTCAMMTPPIFWPSVSGGCTLTMPPRPHWWDIPLPLHSADSRARCRHPCPRLLEWLPKCIFVPDNTTRHRNPEECGSLLRQRQNTKSWSAIVVILYRIVSKLSGDYYIDIPIQCNIFIHTSVSSIH